MFNNHKKQYPLFDNDKRLECLNTTAKKINYMSNSLKARKERESVIEQEDINNMIEVILENPTLGGLKTSLILLEKEKGLISGTFCQDAKKELTDLLAVHVFNKKIESELEKNKREREPKEEEFEHITPTKSHQVWSTDYTFLELFGISFAIAEVYENFSQAYLGVAVDFSSSTDIAETALIDALKFTNGEKPDVFISDNGGQFIGERFQTLLKKVKIIHKRTPPGEPWYNGALESGNTNLKKSIYTKVAFAAAENTLISKQNIKQEDILIFLKDCIKDAVVTINEKIPRPNSGTTPINVLQGMEKEQKEKKEIYKNIKKQQRRENINKGGTFKQKIRKGFSEIVKTISDEKIFAIGELLNNRVGFLT